MTDQKADSEWTFRAESATTTDRIDGCVRDDGCIALAIDAENGGVALERSAATRLRDWLTKVLADGGSSPGDLDTCRRCDSSKKFHDDIPGIGLVCPMAVPRFAPVGTGTRSRK